ncbi:hypothetical protein HDU91_001577, partial [Kappamyces sp. JEL0680]
MVVKHEEEKAASKSLIETLRQQLLNAGLSPEVASKPPEGFAESAAMVSKCTLLEAKVLGMEKSQQEWKNEKARMQKAIGSLKSEIEEYKVQMEERKSADSVSGQPPAPAAVPAATSWFKGYASTAPPAPAEPAVSAAQPVAVPISAAASISTGNLSVPTASAAPAQTTAAPAARSWWSRTAAPAATAVSAPATSPSGSGSPADSEAKIKQLEQELESTKKLLQDAKRLSTANLPGLPEKTNPELEQLKTDLAAQIALNESEKKRLQEAEAKLLEARTQNDLSTAQLYELQKSLNASLASVIEGEEKAKQMNLQIQSLNAEIVVLGESLRSKDAAIKDFEKSTSLLSEASSEVARLKLQVDSDSVVILQLRDAIVQGTETLKRETSVYQQRVEDLDKKMALQKGLLDQKTEAHQAISTELANLQSQMALKNEEIVTLAGELKVAQTRLNAAKTDGNDTVSADALDALQDEFKKQMSVTKADHADAMAKKQQEIDAIASQLNALKAEQALLLGQAEERNASRASLETALESERSHSKSMMEELHAKVTMLEQEVAEKNEELESMHKAVAHNEMVAAELAQSLKYQIEQEKKIKELAHKEEVANSEIASLQGQIALLQTELKSMESRVKSSSEIDEAKRTDQEHSELLKRLEGEA